MVTVYEIRDRRAFSSQSTRDETWRTAKQMHWRAPDGTSASKVIPVATSPSMGSTASAWPAKRRSPSPRARRRPRALLDLGIPRRRDRHGRVHDPEHPVLADLPAGRLSGQITTTPARGTWSGSPHASRASRRPLRIAAGTDAPPKGDAADYCAAGLDPRDHLDASEPVYPRAPSGRRSSSARGRPR